VAVHLWHNISGMRRALPYAFGFGLPVAIVAGVRLGGPWTLIPIVLLLGVLPLLDYIGGLNLENPGEDESLAANPWFRLITWAWTAVQPVMILWVLGAARSGRLSALEIVGITASLGMITGSIGITFAHELVHRSARFERALGEIVLATTSYTHYAIEHVYGHHRHVGTPLDSATARYGESLFHFIPRSVFGGAQSAWRFETARLLKRGRPWWHASNRMLRYGVTQLVLYPVIFGIFGWRGLAVFAGQAALAIGLVETINYVEHYGLERREIAPGRYERVMPWHSWNSSHRLSNWLLINLARHADHHMLASKRYQILDHLATAPQLPCGYGTMFLIALVPPLWRRVMDPRVAAWRTCGTEPL
jgi:alkane 1-monooxygenase